MNLGEISEFSMLVLAIKREILRKTLAKGLWVP